MPKIFLCHAGEDKRFVEAVYASLIRHDSTLTGWIDKYEVLAGESLIDRIAAGMDGSDKFIVFLSRVAIEKPWVQRELRKALIREIEGVDPYFIIPVLIDELDSVPSFLEGKKYIDIPNASEEMWVRELHGAIMQRRPVFDPWSAPDNLEISIEPGSGASEVRVVFATRFWPLKASFVVKTRFDIVSARHEWRGAPVTLERNGRSKREERVYAHSVDEPQVRPGLSAVFVLELDRASDPDEAIEWATRWEYS